MLSDAIKGYLLYHNVDLADKEDEEKNGTEQDFTEAGLDILLVRGTSHLFSERC